jgi:hypothetical protein
MSLKYFIEHLMGQNIIDQEAAMHQLKEKDPMFKKIKFTVQCTSERSIMNLWSGQTLLNSVTIKPENCTRSS